MLCVELDPEKREEQFRINISLETLSSLAIDNYSNVNLTILASYICTIRKCIAKVTTMNKLSST